MPTPTPSQRQCIEAKGNVLVVASAGAGKTSTLVQRCLHLLRHENISLDQILMVTFTEAAAAQMRSRIREELQQLRDGAPADSPQAIHLDTQMALLDTAQICTLHSFCLHLVRRHFYRLDIAPTVLVMDEKQTAPLINQTLDAVLKRHYESQTPESAAILQMIAALGRGSDEFIRTLVVKLHRYTQVLPNPDQWLNDQCVLYQQTQPSAWCEWLLNGIDQWRVSWLPELQAYAGKAPAVDEAISAMQTPLANAKGDLQDRLRPLRERFGQIGRADQNRKNWPYGTKTRVRDLIYRFFDEAAFLHSALTPNEAGIDPVQQDWDWVRPNIWALLQLTRQFAAAFAQAKRDLGGVDFSDLEQFALRLLREPDLAAHWRARFHYIFVDECQDINRAQDAILTLLSWEGEQGNRFLVGDVKQSIYRFRLADPKIFSEYEKSWREDKKKGQRIPLAENFRSREAILDFVNSLFAELMRPSIGGVGYEADVHLQFGNRPERAQLSRAAEPAGNNPVAPRVELHLIDESEDESEENGEESDGPGAALLNLLTMEREARLLAWRLRQLREQQHLIWDGDENRFRPVQWGDMVVLVRSPSDRVEAFAKEFHRLGVPLAAARSGFFQSLEITDLLSLLKLLDNPLQDVPLLAVLRSPFVALSLDELVEVRSHNKEKPFWQALHKFHEDPPPANTPAPLRESAWAKVDLFLRWFASWRNLVRQTSLSACLERILSDTHYAEVLRAETRGEERVANVRRLLTLVQEYDPWQRQGLYRFLRFVQEQQEAEVELEPASAQDEDAVRLMSIHKAKGLEFPVVALAAIETKFNRRDLSGDILLHPRYGLCPKIKPPNLVESYPSLAYWLARWEEDPELLGEEMRLWYVALTRACDTLILVGAGKSPTWRDDPPATPTDRDLLKAQSYLGWLQRWLPLATTGQDWTDERTGQNRLLSWKIYTIKDPVLGEEPVPACASTTEPAAESDPAGLLRLEQRIRFVYPYQAATTEAAIKRISEVIWAGADREETSRPVLDPLSPSSAGRRQPPQPFARPIPDSAVESTKGGAEDKSGQLTFDLFEVSSSRGKATPTARSPIAPAARQFCTLAAVKVGDAHHRFLETLDLEKLNQPRILQRTAQTMLQSGELTEEEFQSLDLKAIQAFWTSPVGRRILSQPSTLVQRELPFTIRLLPEDLAKLGLCPHATELQGEQFIGRGQVDLAVIREKEIWLLDFKTDRVRQHELPDKTSVYSAQLKLYALALEQIYRRPVTERWLHFLSLRKTVPI